MDETFAFAGATGLVGRAALARLLALPAHVVAVGRRAPEVSHARLRTVVTDFVALATVPSVPVKAALCALGTTIKAAGSQAAFRAVDFEAVVAFARWAQQGGARTFALVSAVGADPSSRNSYLKVKGETEEAIARLGFARFVALRPGLLMGDRRESRPGEALARAVMPALNPLLLGGLRRYRGVAADTVAAALVAAAVDDTPGRLVWEHDALTSAGAARKAGT